MPSAPTTATRSIGDVVEYDGKKVVISGDTTDDVRIGAQANEALDLYGEPASSVNWPRPSSCQSFKTW